MVTVKRIRTANDNIPSLQQRRAYQRAVPTGRTSPDMDNQRPHSEAAPTSPESRSSKGLRLTQVLWVGSILAAICASLFAAPVSYQALSLLALLWMSVWSSYVFAEHQQARLKEIAVLSAMASLLSGFVLLANSLSLSIALVDGAILFTLGSLVMATTLKSRMALLCSITASLVWAILTLNESVAMSTLLFVFPFIALAQAYVGTRLNSALTIGLSIITAYIWVACLLTDMWSSGHMPLTFAATAIAVIGMAHHRAGKAAEDKRITGSILHIYAGWAAAIAGAVTFQLFWLDSNILGASTASISAQGLQNWKRLVIACLMIVFTSGIIRYKYSQITLTGIVLVTLSVALLPLMLWVPDWPVAVMDSLAGMRAIPTFGIIIGAAIIASSVGFILNGLRRKANIMIALGLFGLCIEAVLLLNPSMITVDNMIVFFTTLMLALTVGAAVAGQSVAHQAPAPRLKPNELLA